MTDTGLSDMASLRDDGPSRIQKVGYTSMGADRYGCATRRGKGTCDNGHTITRQAIEALCWTA